MIDKLKKVFNKAVKEEVEMKQEAKVVESSIVEAKAPADLVDLLKETSLDGLSMEKEFASLQASLLSKTEELAKAMSEIEGLKTTLKQFKEQTLLAEQAKKNAVLEARKKDLEDSVGTVQAAAVFESTKGLDDASFDTVLKALKLQRESEKDAPGFKEIGVAGEADLSKVVPESLEMKILKDKLKAA